MLSSGFIQDWKEPDVTEMEYPLLVCLLPPMRFEEKAHHAENTRAIVLNAISIHLPSS